MTEDAFATVELRRRVIAAWRSSPARFRADANVEEDLALTGYRDRVIIELAQNAADAATRIGVAGRLVFSLDGDTLTATNTGAPLDAAGVESISVARASAKIDHVGTVGHFGVGFAAVLAVTDEPSIVSTAGAVRWSRADALATIADLPELAAERANRGDRVPVLRLPFPVAPQPLPPVDGETAVILPLRDREVRAAVVHQLSELEPTTLLSLPGLGEIVIRLDGSERVLTAERSGDLVVASDGGTTTRWLVVSGSGPLPLELLADRPVEEQRFDRWQVSWALPVDVDHRIVDLPASATRVVRAPTPVDDPLTLPALLIASYPLDASRRRITAGPLADAVTGHAATVLVEALLRLPADPSILRLLPTGFPDGLVDGGLHAAVLDRLRETPWLPAAAEPELRMRPRETVAVADPLVPALRDVVPALLPAGWSNPELGALGVQRPTLAELVEALGSVDREPSWWRDLYAALDKAVLPGPDRDPLGALPVPLSDGSLVTGPRGLALVDDDGPIADLSAIGVRMVHPAAAHPLLRSLGAVDGTARDLLEQPQVEAAVAASYDEEDPEPIAVAVLALLRASRAGHDELPWLADLALTDQHGEWRPAGELVLPGGLMAAAIAEDSAFGVLAAEWGERWGVATMVAAGVLDGPAVLREDDVTGPDHDLDAEADWWATLPPDCSIEEFVAVRDLEQLRADALPALVTALANGPLRSAVVDPVLATTPDGSRLRRRSYTAWWLSTRPVLAGVAPTRLRLATAEGPLHALYDAAPAGLDREFLRALGVVGGLDDADPDDVLATLAEIGRAVDRRDLRAIYRWLSGLSVSPPPRVRAVRDGEVVIVDAASAVVVDAPDLLPLLGALAVVPVAVTHATDLAECLDLPLASELADFEVTSAGEVVDDAVIHDRLLVTDLDGEAREVSWRLVGHDLHVDGRNRAFGLGRGRAWQDGAWPQRHRRTEVLNHPDQGMMQAAEDDLDDDSEG